MHLQVVKAAIVSENVTWNTLRRKATLHDHIALIFYEVKYLMIFLGEKYILKSSCLFSREKMERCIFDGYMVLFLVPVPLGRVPLLVVDT